MTGSGSIPLVLAIGIAVAVLMYYGYLKIIRPKREQNDRDYSAYLWASYTAGFIDRTQGKIRREFGGRNPQDRITVDGMVWYTNGYDAARDGTTNLAEHWLNGVATADQKEVFYKILQVMNIAEEFRES